MKRFAYGLIAMMAVGVSQSASASNQPACQAETVIREFQKTFDEAAKVNSYNFKRVETASFQTKVPSGQSVTLQAGFEDVQYTNGTLFDLEAFTVTTADILDRTFWVVLVDTSSCAIVDAKVLDSTDI